MTKLKTDRGPTAFGYLCEPDQASAQKSEIRGHLYFASFHKRHPKLAFGRWFIDREAPWQAPLFSRNEGKKLNDQLRRGDHVLLHQLSQGCRGPADWTRVVESWVDRGITFHIIDLSIDSSEEIGESFIRALGIMAEGRSLAARKGWVTRRRRKGRPAGKRHPNRCVDFDVLGPGSGQVAKTRVPA